MIGWFQGAAAAASTPDDANNSAVQHTAAAETAYSTQHVSVSTSVCSRKSTYQLGKSLHDWAVRYVRGDGINSEIRNRQVVVTADHSRMQSCFGAHGFKNPYLTFISSCLSSCTAG